MNKLFQQSTPRHRIEEEETEELEHCYEEITILKEQLSSQGIQHLLKVKQLEQQLERAYGELRSIGGIRQILQKQVQEMDQQLKYQHQRNREMEKQLLILNQNLEVRSKELMEIQSRVEEKSRQEPEDSQLKIDSDDITQEELILVNQKAQLLELKNEALLEELRDAQQQLQTLRNNHVAEIERYEIKIHELSARIEKLNGEENHVYVMKSENNVLHKELELKILEIEELKDRLQVYENQPQKPQSNVRNLQDNIQEYLEQALEQIEEMRRQNESLKSEQPPDRNIKALKGELITIKSEYSNSLRENNLLIEENARLEKQKNQLFIEVEKYRKGESNNWEKAYMTVCEEKNHMQVELMNTYQQIEKLNNLLLKKQQEIQHLSGAKMRPLLNQAAVVKAAMQNAQQLQHNQWSNIQSKIQMLKNENELLKKGMFGEHRMNTVHR